MLSEYNQEKELSKQRKGEYMIQSEHMYKGKKNEVYSSKLDIS